MFTLTCVGNCWRALVWTTLALCLFLRVKWLKIGNSPFFTYSTLLAQRLFILLIEWFKLFEESLHIWDFTSATSINLNYFGNVEDNFWQHYSTAWNVNVKMKSTAFYSCCHECITCQPRMAYFIPTAARCLHPLSGHFSGILQISYFPSSMSWQGRDDGDLAGNNFGLEVFFFDLIFFSLHIVKTYLWGRYT